MVGIWQPQSILTEPSLFRTSAYLSVTTVPAGAVSVIVATPAMFW